MVRHIVAWDFKEGLTEAQNRQNAQTIKERLEGLVGHIEGIVEIKVYAQTLATGNRDVVLNSLFESEQALAAYQIHPEHRKISEFVGTVMQNRACIDYME